MGSGGSGGIFAPSLFIGAMLGGFFGSFVNGYFPDIAASPGAYALVAMGGLVAGTTRAPITAIIIVFELTNDYNIILPLMITCIISTILSSKLSRESIYTLKLLLRKINLKEGTEINVMKSIYVRDVYSPDFESIPETANFIEVVNSVISRRDPYFVILDNKGMLLGIVSIHDIKSFLFEGEELRNVIIARDLISKDFETVTVGDNCRDVIKKMSRTGFSALPVVKSEENHKMLGMIWQKDILDAYHLEIERKDMVATMVDKIQLTNEQKEIHFLEGYSILEVPVPKIFVGSSIKELDIRVAYGIDVLSVKQKTKQGSGVKMFPRPDFLFQDGDLITVAGKINKINLLKNLV